MSLNNHKNLHQDSSRMHEVKGFPVAANNYAYQKDVRGLSAWQRTHRLENALAEVLGYAAPTTEVDGDVYIVDSPDLDINGLVWQSATTVRVTFTSGYTNIYATSNYLQLSGAADDVHNGVFLITATNASYLDVTIADVTDGTDDVASGSTASGYVTHEDYDPENLANSQTIPRQGVVKYYSAANLWYGDSFQQGDEVLNVATGQKVEFNGTDSVSSATLLIKEITISAADLKTMFTTPIELIAAAGANKVIVVDSIIGFLDYGAATYTGGGTVRVIHGTSSHILNVAPSSLIKASSDGNYTFTQDSNTVLSVFNEALEITNQTAVFATGDGVLKLKIIYSIADYS